jgi:hypothetical protein
MTPATPPGDIDGREDIAGLVPDSYRRVFADELLGAIFTESPTLTCRHTCR